MYNHYWNIYLNLEDEILKSSRYIDFSDKHLKVFSDKFVDILLRAASEVESISKDLFFKFGGTFNGNNNEFYFDSVCLNYLNNSIDICKKIIFINDSKFNFSKEAFGELVPLKNSFKRSGSSWLKAYQAVKHNRYENFKKATLENCLLALGSLFILNLYENFFNLDDKPVASFEQNSSFDPSFGSKIFCLKIPSLPIAYPHNEISSGYESNIFVIKISDENYKKIMNEYEKEDKAARDLLLNTPYLADYIKANPSYSLKDKQLFEVFLDVGGELLNKYRALPRNGDRILINSPKFVVLNKKQIFYTK